MTMRELFLMFSTSFNADLGDTTQLGAILFAAERKFPPTFAFAA